jgi:hypothetical protein
MSLWGTFYTHTITDTREGGRGGEGEREKEGKREIEGGERQKDKDRNRETEIERNRERFLLWKDPFVRNPLPQKQIHLCDNGINLFSLPSWANHLSLDPTSQHCFIGD